MRLITSLIAAAALVPALAQADAIKVGIANDISGPFSALGAEARDGFNLAIKQLGGKLGGQPAEFLQTDMGGNPDQARQLVTRYLQREKVDFFTGPIGSNVALAVGPRCSPPRSPTCPTTRAPASSPAPSAIRTGSAPRTRTTPSTRPPAGRGRQRLQEDVHHGPDYPAGRTRSTASSAATRPRATRSTPSWARSTTRPSWRRSARPSRTRSTSSCPAAWASISSSSSCLPACRRVSS